MTNEMRPLKVHSSYTTALGAGVGAVFLTGEQDAVILRASGGVLWGKDLAGAIFPLNLNEVLQYALQGNIYIHNPGAGAITVYVVELEA